MRLKVRKKPGEYFVPLCAGYLISNMGRIYSQAHGIIMRQNKNSSGYNRVTLYIDGKRKHIFVHIKVVEKFGDCNGTHLVEGFTLREQHLSIDHIDGNKKHNQVANLEIVTHVENCIRRSEKRRALINEKQARKISALQGV